jgi:hypothetical protein
VGRLQAVDEVWLQWDGPLTRDDASALKAQREQETGATYKVDIWDDWYGLCESGGAE